MLNTMANMTTEHPTGHLAIPTYRQGQQKMTCREATIQSLKHVRGRHGLEAKQTSAMAYWLTTKASTKASRHLHGRQQTSETQPMSVAENDLHSDVD